MARILAYGLRTFTRLCCVTVVTWSPSVHADYEGVAHGVALYEGPGRCSSTNVNWSDDNATAFKQEIRLAPNSYLAANTEDWLNGDVESDDFHWNDDDEVATIGTDWADVVFFAGHGSGICPISLSSSYTILHMGDNSVSCEVRLGGTANQVQFGAGGGSSDANVMMMYASVSLAYCAAEAGNIIRQIDVANSGAQFTLLNGFNNSPQDRPESPTEVRNYVSASSIGGIGDNWGSIMSNRDGDVAECSVSSVLSSSRDNADFMFFWGGLKDFKDTGSHEEHWYYYDCARDSCDEDGDTTYALPWC